LLVAAGLQWLMAQTPGQLSPVVAVCLGLMAALDKVVVILEFLQLLLPKSMHF